MFGLPSLDMEKFTRTKMLSLGKNINQCSMDFFTKECEEMACFDSLLYNVPRWIENVSGEQKRFIRKKQNRGTKKSKTRIEVRSLTRKRRKPGA